MAEKDPPGCEWNMILDNDSSYGKMLHLSQLIFYGLHKLPSVAESVWMRSKVRLFVDMCLDYLQIWYGRLQKQPWVIQKQGQSHLIYTVQGEYKISCAGHLKTNFLKLARVIASVPGEVWIWSADLVSRSGQCGGGQHTQLSKHPQLERKKVEWNCPLDSVQPIWALEKHLRFSGNFPTWSSGLAAFCFFGATSGKASSAPVTYWRKGTIEIS